MTGAPAGATDRTITLPTAAANTGRKIEITHIGAGAGKVIIDGEGSETINGKLTVDLFILNDRVTLLCDGTGWLRQSSEWNWIGFTPTINNFSSTNDQWYFQREGSDMLIRGWSTSSTTVGGNIEFVIPLSLTIDTGSLDTDSVASVVGTAVGGDATGNNWVGTPTPSSTTVLLTRATDGANASVFRAATPFTWASGDKFGLTVRVPISEWA